MMKRLISFLLALVLFAGVLTVGAPTVSAANDMKGSEDLIELIKVFEGFVEKPKGDYGDNSIIGYGTTCDPKDYPNGITHEEADALLRSVLKNFESSINSFARRKGVKLSQQQFDALLSFTYNVGAGWLSDNKTSTLKTAVINGATGNDILYAMTMWCTAGGEILTSLINRRLKEANLYLNGVYSNTVPSHYDYVRFSSGMTGAENTASIQGYDSDKTASIRVEPTKSGYRFLGWYTSASGGEWVTTLNASHAGRSLYGHWQKNDATKGIVANYKRVTTKSTPVFDEQTKKAVKELKAGTSVTITADYMDANGIKWGKTSDGWIDLAKTRAPSETPTTSGDMLKVTVNTDGVNIRRGPGTNYAKNGKANRGDVLSITAIEKVGNYLWGQFKNGWIRLDYTDYDIVSSDTSVEDEKVTATGIIVNTDKLNVRNKPGTSGTTVIASYSRGDAVTITLQQKVGSVLWGKTPKGWISLRYVKLDTDESEKPEEGGTESKPTDKVVATGVVIDCTILKIRAGAGTNFAQVGGLAAGTEVVIYEIKGTGERAWGRIDKGWISLRYVELGADNTEPETKPEGDPIATGIIVDCDTLRVRAGAGTKYAEVGRIAVGTKVEIYEITGRGSQRWGRIAKGWISLTYVDLNESTDEPDDTQKPSGDPIHTGKIVDCTTLRVRAGAGTKYAEVGKVAKGEKVAIYEITGKGTQRWARIAQGWISMNYVELLDAEEKPETKPEEKPEEKPETKPEGGHTGKTQLGTIARTTELTIRAGAGTNYDKVGKLKRGDKVVILETAKVGDATWGRIDKGWIHMYYVDLDTTEIPEGAVYKTVTTELRIRAGAGTSYDKVGTYKKGDIVLIYEQTTVNKTVWGRTDKGWISLDYTK